MSADAPALLLDEMLSGTIAEQLRARGVDAIAVVEDPALVSTPDADLLDYATMHRRVLVTLNIADFALIGTDWRANDRRHHGIIFVTISAFRQDRSFVSAIVAALGAIWETGLWPIPGAELFLRRAP